MHEPPAPIESILERVGGTPALRLRRMAPADTQVLLKLEHLNPGGSIEDRFAAHAILAALRGGRLAPGGGVVVAGSARFGISVALAARVLAVRAVVVTAEPLTPQARATLAGYGAEVIAADGDADEAAERARDRLASDRGLVPVEPLPAAAAEFARELVAHAEEEGGVDAVVVGGATPLLAAELKVAFASRFPAAKVTIAAGVPAEQAEAARGRLAREEGVLAGPSTGANLVVALALAAAGGPGTRVFTVAEDSGERYLNLRGGA